MKLIFTISAALLFYGSLAVAQTAITSSAGGDTASLTHQLRSSTGQSSASGVSASASYQNRTGFWYAAAPPVSLALSVIGNGMIRAISTEYSEMTCSAASCSQSYGTGSEISLSASPANGSHFTGWGGDCSGTGSCSVKLTSGKSISATFLANPLIPVNGVCGSANGGRFPSVPTTDLCIAGIASTVSGSGPWDWSCIGLSGGTTAACIAGNSNATDIPDGIVNPEPGKTAPGITDALLVFKHTAGGAQLTLAQAANADIAPLGSDGKPLGNGVTDIADVIMILRRVVGIGNW